MGLALSRFFGGSGAPDCGSRSARAGAACSASSTATAVNGMRMRLLLPPREGRGWVDLTERKPCYASVAKRRRDAKHSGRHNCVREPGDGTGRTPRERDPAVAASSALHGLEKLTVRLGVFHFVEQEFDGRELIHRVQELAQDPDLGELALVGDELFLAGAGTVDVDRREHALLGDAPVEVDFAVARALELLVDDIVHLRAGVDERGGEDREAAALLDVARRAKEALGTLQGAGVDAAGQHLAR